MNRHARQKKPQLSVVEVSKPSAKGRLDGVTDGIRVGREDGAKEEGECVSVGGKEGIVDNVTA